MAIAAKQPKINIQTIPLSTETREKMADMVATPYKTFLTKDAYRHTDGWQAKTE